MSAKFIPNLVCVRITSGNGLSCGFLCDSPTSAWETKPAPGGSGLERRRLDPPAFQYKKYDPGAAQHLAEKVEAIVTAREVVIKQELQKLEVPPFLFSICHWAMFDAYIP
jgi:hypothetical protein